jgi:citrate lyase subunit beta / citryl-CoA lyase
MLRRTLLMTPGNRPDLMEKARGAVSDAVWLDLEDAVPPAEKDEATKQVLKALESGAWGCRELLVRVNPVPGRGLHDIALLMAAERKPAGFVLSKVESSDEVAAAGLLIESLSTVTAPPSPLLWLMVETPQAVLDVERLAAASPLTSALLFGAGALRPALGLRHSAESRDDGLLYARSRTVLAARAHGLSALDGAFDFPGDIGGTARDARRSFDLGFDGKLILSPRQIQAVFEAWAPDEDELRRARELADALGKMSGTGATIGADKSKVVVADSARATVEGILARAAASPRRNQDDVRPDEGGK